MLCRGIRESEGFSVVTKEVLGRVTVAAGTVCLRMVKWQVYENVRMVSNRPNGNVEVLSGNYEV